MVEFTLLKNMGQMTGRVRALNFRKAKLQFKKFLDVTHKETALWEKGTEQS